MDKAITTGQNKLDILDGLRGLAAFYVMVGHSRWLLWEGYATGFTQHPQTYTTLNKVLMYFFSTFLFGHEAVLLFFVLSGFVIHLRYAKQIQTLYSRARFDWLPYVRRRARRLYPTLVFSLVLTALLDWFGTRLGYSIYLQRTPYFTINENVVPHHGQVTLVGNLAFVMNTYVPTWGTNGPLWSLKFEWWFYMLYPLFWWFSKTSIALATILMSMLFVLSQWPGLWAIKLFGEVFGGMLAWWFGVLLADVYAGRIRIPMGRIAWLAILLVFLPFGHVPSAMHDILWALGFSGLLASCFFLQSMGWDLRLLRRLKPLGEMSYTLYVIHFPILVLMSGYVASASSTNQLPSGFSYVLLGIFVTLIAAYAAHFAVEKPFMTRR